MVNIYPSTIHMIMGGEGLSEFCKGIYRQEMGITRKTAMAARRWPLHRRTISGRLLGVPLPEDK
jgi:hypothetical protein